MSYPEHKAAPTPREKAWVYLQRALGHRSKRLIAGDIDRALGMLYSSHDAEGYVAHNKLPPTKRGLHAAARKLLDKLAEEDQAMSLNESARV